MIERVVKVSEFYIPGEDLRCCEGTEFYMGKFNDIGGNLHRFLDSKSDYT